MSYTGYRETITTWGSGGTQGRGTAGIEEQRNTEYRGSEGIKEQRVNRNIGHRGTAGQRV